ncbi:MAG TPA: ABC transporter ATP-binding protein [Actinomycetota bacterium]|nr:ABC transporter ATP-binding protein [Actinomycetota bacterium]
MTALLSIRGVSKIYQRGIVANDDVSLELEAGQIYGLLGPNGAGKTTLVSQILGLAQPTSGSIHVEGVDVTRKSVVARKACSYQPQTNAPIEGLTPREAIELVGRIRGATRVDVRRRAEELMDTLQIVEWADKQIPLSGGVGRLTSFCMAAVAPGRICVLDEPTNDVDPLRRKLLWKQVRFLADAGSAVLLVTHNVLEAERSVNRLGIMSGGRLVVQGTPESLMARFGVISLDDVYARVVGPGGVSSKEMAG